MSNVPVPENSALNECLSCLKHLFIDITRLKHEPVYGERRGGYCDVQVATLDSEVPSASTLVAMKKLFLGARSSEPLRLAVRLARELKVWAGLRHAHVLPLLGFYLGDNYQTAVLISEYMLFGDLENYITKMVPTDFERLHLVRDLTDGLAYLHMQTPAIRHGDLKPGNVLVNPQRRALIADFGLSKALGIESTGFTTGNDGRGTVRFSGPEMLLRGAEGQSLANDIWSWACVVLEVMTGRIPFPNIRFEPQLIAALIQGQTPCDAEILAQHLPQFNELLLKCWNPQPDQRPEAAHCLRMIQSALPSFWPTLVGPGDSHQPQQQSPQQQQSPCSPGAPPIPPNPSLQPLPRAKRGPGHHQPRMSMLFHEVFATAFSNWLAQQQLTLDPPRVDGKDVVLHKLFLMVGALGGCRAVSEKGMWTVIGAIGFPSCNGSQPEVSDQLFQIYREHLADFEVHWHNSLRPRDPSSVFPLPPDLHYLHPDIERLATAQLIWQLPPDSGARIPTPSQTAQVAPGNQHPAGVGGFQDHQQQQAQCQPRINEPKSANLLEECLLLSMETFRRKLDNLEAHIKALKNRRETYLRTKMPQALEQAESLRVKISDLQNLTHEMTEVYAKRLLAAMGFQQPASRSPSPAMEPHADAKLAPSQNRPWMVQSLQGGLGAAQDTLPWQENISLEMAEELSGGRLQAMVDSRAAAVQQGPQPRHPKSASHQQTLASLPDTFTQPPELEALATQRKPQKNRGPRGPTPRHRLETEFARSLLKRRGEEDSDGFRGSASYSSSFKRARKVS